MARASVSIPKVLWLIKPELVKLECSYPWSALLVMIKGWVLRTVIVYV